MPPAHAQRSARILRYAFDDAPKAAEPAAEEPQTEAEEEPEAEED